MAFTRAPHVASVTFITVAVLGVAGVVWGATQHAKPSDSIGSTKQQAAALSTIGSRLDLGATLAYDKTFTACGGAGVGCVTGQGNVEATRIGLAAAFMSAGGSLGQCAEDSSTSVQVPNRLPAPTCTSAGRLDGTAVTVLLGSGWQLPGSPAPQTAAIILLRTTTPPDIQHAVLPDSTPNVAALIPAGWSSTPQVCTGDTCSTHTATATVSAHGTLVATANALASSALAAGYRVDGSPCVYDPAAASCEIQAERWQGAAGAVNTVLDATLVADAAGNVTGSVKLTDES